MTYHEKKELEALRKLVQRNPLNDVVHASYPEINPELEYKKKINGKLLPWVSP